MFCFLPNPNLRPEVGKNKEAGLNLKYDGMFPPGDSFRGKFNVFRNDVEDYIDLVGFGAASSGAAVRRSFIQFYQYQNIAHARIEGFEAETLYDAGTWFVGVAGHLIRTARTPRPISDWPLQHPREGHDHGRRAAARPNRLMLSAQWSSFGANNDHSGELSAGDVLRSRQSVSDLPGDQGHRRSLPRSRIC